MKRHLFTSLCVMAALSASAQETYENAKLLGDDLNGTARFVGMGGAMGALGADLSTIGTNPAGIGLFRHSTANVSLGVVSQQVDNNFSDGDKTRMSFDQAGFVYSARSGRNSFINVAFNYHKSKNFSQILSAAGRLEGASQNKLSYAKGAEGLFDLSSSSGNVHSDDLTFNALDYLYYNTILYSENENKEPVFLYTEADGYQFGRANTGYISDYDFNVSCNINDRVYLGFTVGIHDVHYNGSSKYLESLVQADGSRFGDAYIVDSRKITGTGFDVKAGAIFRPFENSPFRIGVSVATPIWYDLTTENTTAVVTTVYDGLWHNYDEYLQKNTGDVFSSYDFKLTTPWKFGLSLGTTVGDYLALGAEYEYADYSSTDTRINTGYDWYYDTESSSSDREMNNHTEKTLKGVSTIKLGAEYKPMKNLAIRLGYNYVSPMYEKDGYKDVTLWSPGTYYSSSSDYTNWKSTNRITCGFGYNVGKLSLDLAYQYSVQSGDFSPFTNYFGNEELGITENVCDAVKVDNKRHQVLLTLGYHF